MRTLALVVLFLFVPHSVSAATVIFLTSGTSFSTPSDWTTTNTVECIGSGGDGRIASAVTGRPGGGGGAYAKVSNLALSGSISYVIAAGGSQNDTYFNGVASTSASLSCAPGKDATASVPGAGGLTVDSTGTVEFAGGNGSTGLVCSGGVDGTGGGGGGSGGPGGIGGDGDDLGTGGLCGGGLSSLGNEWNYGPVAGCGGGGHGFGGGDGNSYGGGGGGGGAENCAFSSTPGAGAQGIVVIQYWPTLSSLVKIFGGKTTIQGGRVRIY